eukprot:gene6235-2855_t
MTEQMSTSTISYPGGTKAVTQGTRVYAIKFVRNPGRPADHPCWVVLEDDMRVALNVTGDADREISIAEAVEIFTTFMKDNYDGRIKAVEIFTTFMKDNYDRRISEQMAANDTHIAVEILTNFMKDNYDQRISEQMAANDSPIVNAGTTYTFEVKAALVAGQRFKPDDKSPLIVLDQEVFNVEPDDKSPLIVLDQEVFNVEVKYSETTIINLACCDCCTVIAPRLAPCWRHADASTPRLVPGWRHADASAFRHGAAPY